MRIRQTHNAELIQSIVTHEAIWPHVSDDACDKATYKPSMDGCMWLEVVDCDCLGVYLIHRHNAVTYEIHTCLLPAAWGNKSKKAGKLVLDWIFQNTPCQKVITQVPEDNSLALRYAIRCGMVQEGVNRASFLKNGKLLDMTQLGITKKEHTCQQQPQL